MKYEKTRLVALSGLLSTMIFIVTLIHIPTGNGYTHAGDGIIYLAASILPTPYAIISAAIGGLLADGLSGGAIWIPATIIIKSLTATCFSCKSEKIINLRNCLAIIPSFILCFIGYGVYEIVFILGEFSRAAYVIVITQIWSYMAQVIISAVLYYVIGTVLDKSDFKNKYFKL